MRSLVASVAVENTFFNTDSDYSYLVPEHLCEKLAVGSAVKIPFGRGNIQRNGIVLSISDCENTENLKEIVSCSEKPVLTEEAISLSLWMKERWFCTTYECVKLMLPKGYGKISDAGERMVRLKDEIDFSCCKLTPKQKSVCNLLNDVGSAGVNEVLNFCSVGIGVLKNLEKYGLVEFFIKETYRNPYKSNSLNSSVKIELSKEQQKAYDMFSGIMDDSGGTALLFGVTGSGKTQVYLSLIDKALKNDKGVIVMVPEIGLTPQVIAIFKSRFQNQVAVFHSGLSLGERYDEYKRVSRNEAKIVVGTRSAVFAPVNNLGLIVIDEEQDSAYKSERTPRYHARDIAKFRCAYNKALLLLVSATPSVETYSNAVKGKYSLFELEERYGNATLPDIVTVDMKQEIKSGNKSPISSVLKELIQKNLDNSKQTILLINRRGYNTFIACNECGHVITCPNCSISLTYHSYNNRLMCHYCGYSKQLDNTCPECNGSSVRYSGYGTQRIEEELNAIFPNASVLRMDADTTSRKFAHQKLFDAFSNHEYDILVGTQMVAKGLDFPDVTLVGVVNADNSLYDENYLSGERTFDLITQVVGRSGRRNDRGKAVIQTISPYNQIIECAAKQDYKSFFRTETELRRLMVYPPYCDIYSVFFAGENENSVALCAKDFFNKLVELNKTVYTSEKLIVLGPGPAKISKISNSYRYRLSIKCKNSKKIRELIKHSLNFIDNMKQYKEIGISVDLNPFEMN